MEITETWSGRACRRPDFLDGITALKHLKADPETKSIPVIAITASAMTYKRVTMLAEGFDGFQSKSISVKDFLEEVHRVLDSDHVKAV